jgi:hypothetical protein
MNTLALGLGNLAGPDLLIILSIDEQNRVTLIERGRVPFRLPEDWLEFLLTIVLFVGLLSGLVGGVIASWRF